MAKKPTRTSPSGAAALGYRTREGGGAVLSANRIMAVLLILGFGAYVVRYLLGLSPGEPPVSEDALKGFASAEALNTYINDALQTADKNGVLEREQWFRWTLYVLSIGFAIVAGLIALVFYVLDLMDSEKMRTRLRIWAAACALCTVLSWVAVFALTQITFESLRLYYFISNKNTNPKIAQPGQTIVAKVNEYSPAIKSIQRRFYVSELMMQDSTPYKNIYLCRVSDVACEPQKDERKTWPSMGRMLPELYVDNIAASITLPDDPILGASLFASRFKAQVQYPAWINLDKSGAKNATIDGRIDFWIANKRQAEFAGEAENYSYKGSILSWFLLLGPFSMLGLLSKMAVTRQAKPGDGLEDKSTTTG